ncbi:unnamed protein product, partial [Oikopleura dioica]
QLQQWRNNWNPKSKNDDCEQAFNNHFNEKYTKLGEKWIRKLRREEKQVIEDAYQNYDKSKTPDQLWNEALRGDVNRRRIWYGSAIEKYQMKMVTKLQDSDEQLKFASEALQNFRILQDTDICKRFRLVAMTTTIATKNFRLIQNLGCKIIMAEESAELPESHLVACLTEHTQQMILIGDHQQLRPKVNCYELEKKCNLDISLFERLIKNEFEFVRLGEQHRMQPNISSFMSNCFYNNLKDSVSTVNREEDSVIYLGDDGRVQFINYGSIAKQRPEFFEASDSDGTSKSNKMEAEYVVLIAQQLINSGYKAENITILTLYIGQLFAIREKVRTQLPRSSQPDIQTVDNYQGQENQVVILSTVRSNKEMNGGFATTSNRCCVALSRAKSALFVVGNLEMLRNAQGGAHKNDGKNVWVQIMKHAEDKNVVSEGLRLECPWHPDYKVLIPYVREMEFKKKFKEAFPQGGCPDPCSMIFECGHPCPKTCHDPKDDTHEKFQCEKKCERACKKCNGKSCKDKCFEDCKTCVLPVQKALPCSHWKKVACNIPAEEVKCETKCKRKLSCGHNCKLLCWQDCKSGKCLQIVEKSLPCGHKGLVGKVECRVRDAFFGVSESCVSPCRSILECGHPCDGNCTDCFGGLFHKSCSKICEQAKVCGHICKDKCHKDCPPCEERCTKRCFHSVCDHACFEMCTPCSEPCPEPGCNLLCSDNCEHALAVAKRCRATRLCGHQCELVGHNHAFDSFLHTKDHCAKCNESISEKFYSVIMLTEEYDEEELYVYLPDCQHRIEIEGLDGWVRSVAQETEFKGLVARMSSARYTKIFNKWNMKYENIKSKYRDAARRRREELNVAINSLTSEFERGSLSRRAMRARSVKDKYQLLAKAQFAVKFKKSFEKISDGLKNMIDPDKIFFHRINQIASLTGNVEFSLDSQNQSKDILLKVFRPQYFLKLYQKIS